MPKCGFACVRMEDKEATSRSDGEVLHQMQLYCLAHFTAAHLRSISIYENTSKSIATRSTDGELSEHCPPEGGDGRCWCSPHFCFFCSCGSGGRTRLLASRFITLCMGCSLYRFVGTGDGRLNTSLISCSGSNVRKRERPAPLEY